MDGLTKLGTIKAVKKLREEQNNRVLIDNTILAHSIIQETGWVDTGPQPWGDGEIQTGHIARVPVHSDQDVSDAARSVRYLPGIASLAQSNHLKLADSYELRDETWHQPTGRFRGYGMLDYSLFKGIEFEHIRDPDYTVTFGGRFTPSLEDQRKQRLESKTDPLYRNLVSVLGSNNSQDAWHITTAERNECYCFLTMDFRLIKNVRAQRNNRVLKDLRTRVMTPEEFGKEFEVQPIPPRFFSYHDADGPVVHDQNWPDSKRQKKHDGE